MLFCSVKLVLLFSPVAHMYYIDAEMPPNHTVPMLQRMLNNFEFETGRVTSILAYCTLRSRCPKEVLQKTPNNKEAI